MSETTITKDVHMTLPSDRDQILIVARYDIIKHMRSKRLMAMGAILVLVMALTTFLGMYNQHTTPSAADFMSNYTGEVYLLVLIGVTLFAGDAIVSEFQGRTGYLLFPNPVKKSSLYAGKFLASSGIMAGIIVLYYAVAMAITLAYTGHFTVLGVYSLLLALMFIAAATAVAFLINSILKTSTSSLVLTFFMFLIVLSLITGVCSIAGVKPVANLNFCADTISDVMTSPYPHDTSDTVRGMTIHSYVPDIGISIVVEIVWLVVCGGLGYYLFKRREMVS